MTRPYVSSPGVGHEVIVIEKTVTGTGAADETNINLTNDISWANWIDVYIYYTPSAYTIATANTPTIDIDLEYSYDGTNYADLIDSFAQVTTTAGGERIMETRSDTVGWGPYLRFECAVSTADTTIASYDIVITIVAGV